MQSRPKISIITPVFNAEKDIEACIQSVICQTYQDYEHLIIDGLSSDGTLEIVGRYVEKYPRLRLFSEKDEGIYEAMNKGIDRASGEWLYFMGSDDVFYSPSVLEEIFGSGGEVGYDVVYGNVLWGDTGRVFDGKYSMLKLMAQNLCHQAMFFKRSVFNRIGKFDTEFKAWADYLLNIKLFNCDEIQIKYIDRVIAKYGAEGFSSQSEDQVFLAKREAIFTENFPAEYVLNWAKINELCLEIELQNARSQQLESQITQFNQLVAERDDQISERNRQLLERDRQIFERDRQIFELDSSLSNLVGENCSLQSRISALTGSLSWKLTSPIRYLFDLMMMLKRE